MLMSAPLWLVALIPWLGLAVWLLSGSRQRVKVPFLPLWQGRLESLRTRHRLHVPPASIALLLAAILFGILAASSPHVPRPHSQVHGSLSMIVDRGVTMSAHGAKELRFREAADQALAALNERFADCRLTLITVPDDSAQTVSLEQCASIVTELSPCALDTREALAAAIRQTSGPLLVISDQLLDEPDRAIEIPPRTPIHDVAIAHLAARERPAQVMVEIRNNSTQSTAMVAINSGRQGVRRTIDLPTAPTERNYFFDLPKIGSVVSVQLELSDDVDQDKQAWLVREGGGVRVEPHFAISTELRRLIDVYGRSRPPGEDAQRLSIVREPSEAPQDMPTVIVPPARRAIEPAGIHARDDALTHFARWQNLSAGLDVADERPPQGWTTLVDADGQPLVAVRPAPPNQVWVGFDSPQWAATPDFVIFWTNVFDWVAGGTRSLAAHPLREWDPQWKPTDPTHAEPWPGLHRRSDGTIRAFNPPNVPIPPLRETHWREAIAALAAEPGRLDLSPPLLIAALVCLTLASVAWAAPGPARLPRD
jgi:hypothetical protein